MANTIISLREYLNKGKSFVIPNYQRGYIWGKEREGGGKDSVTYMMDSLIAGYEDGKKEVFIQGVTVSTSGTDIILIDGQQRTTFFYLLLKTLGYNGEPCFVIKYEVRKESDSFLSKKDLLADIGENENEEFQDQYYFKKTLRIVNSIIKEKDIDRNSFLEYLLDKVRFLYIPIPEEKAVTVFTMMNGNKAIMKPQELIKAELLRLVSLNESSGADAEHFAIEWEHNMLRSRYAREWDKWLQWWNRHDVRTLFKTDNVMGLLIPIYYEAEKQPKDKMLSFAGFKELLLSNTKIAKKTFDGLRRLQKRFEDAFFDPIIYNQVGAILRVISLDDREKFLKWYFTGEKPTRDKLCRYYRLAFIGTTHKEITNKNLEAITEKYQKCIDILKSNNLYEEKPEEAFRLLLRLNIDEDNKQANGAGRKFDFSIWDDTDRGRSLEHIYPRSKVYCKAKVEDREVYKNGLDETIDPQEIKRYKEEHGICIFEDGTNSIGNLVLLYGDENSAFSNRSFEGKKKMFFKKPDNRKEAKEIFKSRHLLHTIYKFANSKWTGIEIKQNKTNTIEEFKNYYSDDIKSNGTQK